MYFLAPITNLWSLLLVSLLPDADGIDRGDGVIGRNYDRYALKQKLNRLTHAVNNLHQHMRRDDNARATVVNGTFAAIKAAFLSPTGHRRAPLAASHSPH